MSRDTAGKRHDGHLVRRPSKRARRRRLQPDERRRTDLPRRLRTRAAHTLVAALLVCLAAERQAASFTARWTRLSVDAQLDDDGLLHVRETNRIARSGDLAVLHRQVAFGSGQRVVFKGIFRIAEDGSERALSPGDPSRPDEYRAVDAVGEVVWSLLHGSEPPAPGLVEEQYRVDYDLEGAVSPSWDLPAGRAPLDLFRTEYRSPFKHWDDALRQWRLAWPYLDQRYRLDHDVLLPTRDGPAFEVVEVTYQLRLGAAWRLLGRHGDVGEGIPLQDYRVQRTLEYLREGRPARVDVQEPKLRMAALFALPLAAVAFWIVFLASEFSRRPRADRPYFDANVLRHPPEVVRGLMWTQPKPPLFEEVLRRLAGEGKISIEILDPATDESPPRTQLRLLVPRESLHSWEAELVDAVFGDSEQITSDEIQQRHHGGDFDPDEILRDAFERTVPEKPRSRRPLAGLLGFLVVSIGVALVVWDARQTARPELFALFAGALGAMVLQAAFPTDWWLGRSLRSIPLLLIPVAALTVANVVFQLVPNVPLDGAAACGLALMLLGGYQSFLSRAPKLRGEAGREVEALWWSRTWAAAELTKPHPALHDSWIPHLRALGLEQNLVRWRSRFGAAAGSEPRSADAADPEAPFTGVARSAAPSEDAWADGFFVHAED